MTRMRVLNPHVSLAVVFVAAIAILGAAAASAHAANEYGIESVEASLSTHEAGGHPDLDTSITFVSPVDLGEPIPDTENLSIELPSGLTANPQRFPTCTLVKFNNPFLDPCPVDSQVGIVEVEFDTAGGEIFKEPLYNLPAPEDEVARLGFIGALYPYILDVDLRSGSDYGVTISSKNITNIRHLHRITSTTWAVPASPTHDPERLLPLEAIFCSEASPATEPCAGGSRPSGLAPEPFLTNPASCQPMIVTFRTTSYLLPGQEFNKKADSGGITGCENVPFEPGLSLATTSHRADAPTGLEVTVDMPQEEATNTVNSSPLRSASVVLPEGMTVNSSSADGLQSCSAEQAAFGSSDPADCPDASRLGTLEVVSPALKRPIQGGLFLRTPEPGHLFRFWLVSNELGVNLKIPGEVMVNSSTGRLTTIVPESPQLPAEKVVLRLNGGARAPLRNPLSCGIRSATYSFGPWSGNPPTTGVVPLAVDEDCDSGRFNPRLSAGAISPTAGSFSPFVFDVSREDGEQNLGALGLSLPLGLSAKLAGVSLCPDAAALTGACPANSQVGIVKAAVGAGTQPLWIPQPGKAPTAVYLAGPYKGAPYSVVAVVPAQAGPFDLGVVTVRSGIYIDLETARVTVKSDPLPQILQGVPVEYRRARVEVNRPGFTLNPTSCAEKAVRSSIVSSEGATATPSARFQATDCASLGFAPKLNLKLSGGTRRTAHPRLRALLKAKPGQANIRRVSVALPHSEFLDQAHIGTVCTRVQFAADACPPASVYGNGRLITPLLDQPLEGPVYLRSSSHKLPDLVVDLRGQIHIALAGRIDSVNGGIRTTFESTPDARFRKFVLNLKGGRKGLLVNSRALCDQPRFASVKMSGQNGKVSNGRVVLKNDC